MFRRSPAKQEARQLRAQHNRQFDRSDVDPDSPEYLESHDRVVAAEEKARNRR